MCDNQWHTKHDSTIICWTWYSFVIVLTLAFTSNEQNLGNLENEVSSFPNIVCNILKLKIRIFITCRFCLLSCQSAISPLHGPNWMAMSSCLSTVLKNNKSYALPCSLFDLEPRWSKKNPLLIVQSPCLELTSFITHALVIAQERS